LGSSRDDDRRVDHLRAGRLVVLSNAPSRAYRRHHEVEAPRVDARAFRQGWRVSTRLDRLLVAGLIDASVWQAAVDYRTAWEAALALRSGVDARRMTGNGGDREATMLARMSHASRLRWVDGQLGHLASWLVFVCVIEDQSWHRIGRRLGVRNTTAQTWTIAALRLMTALWHRHVRATRHGQDGAAAVRRSGTARISP
jgi:hypothetical protein